MNMLWVKFQHRAIKYPTPVSASYPAYEHKTLYNVKVAVEVLTDDTATLNSSMFLDVVENFYVSTLTMDYKPLQTICDELSAQVLAKYPDRYVQIEIAEHEESGLTFEYNPYRKFTEPELNKYKQLNTPQTVQTLKEVIVEQQISKVNATPTLDPLQPTPIMREEIGTPFVRQSVGPVEGQIASGAVIGIGQNVTGLIPPLPEVVQQTLNADVLLPNTQTVVTEAVYPEGVTIPKSGLVLGHNSDGHQVKYENGIAYISTDGYEWLPAQAGSNIRMIQIK